jgi:hypothetical protein
MTGNRELVHVAVALDPLTSAIQPPPEIREMADRMLAAQASGCRSSPAPARARQAGAADHGDRRDGVIARRGQVIARHSQAGAGGRAPSAAGDGVQYQRQHPAGSARARHRRAHLSRRRDQPAGSPGQAAG